GVRRELARRCGPLLRRPGRAALVRPARHRPRGVLGPLPAGPPPVRRRDAVPPSPREGVRGGARSAGLAAAPPARTAGAGVRDGRATRPAARRRPILAGSGPPDARRAHLRPEPGLPPAQLPRGLRLHGRGGHGVRRRSRHHRQRRITRLRAAGRNGPRPASRRRGRARRRRRAVAARPSDARPARRRGRTARPEPLRLGRHGRRPRGPAPRLPGRAGALPGRTRPDGNRGGPVTTPESSLVFNIVWTGSVFPYLRWFTASLLHHGAARFRFVANGCPPDQIDLMEEFAAAHAERVVEGFVSSMSMERPGDALDAVFAARDDGDHFCFLDPDILAEGPFLRELLAAIDDG